MKILNKLFLGLLIWVAFACTPEPQAGRSPKMDKLPYFDLAGYIDLEIEKLDGVELTKISKINGQEKKLDVAFNKTDWQEELKAFYLADINKPSLVSSYSTETQLNYLIHKLLPEGNGKVKELIIRYDNDYPSMVKFRMREENLFFYSATNGEFHINMNTNRLDHYSLETTQKVWFLKPTNVKVYGVVK
jgi:hypothetical protein